LVLVSDGGAPFDVSDDQGFVWRVERYSAILGNQAHALRLRWLMSSFGAGQFRGTYWGVKSAPTSYDLMAQYGYSKALATAVIAKIRTDLDRFSDGEASVLEKHGYWLVEAALQRHLPDLISPNAPTPRSPHPDWMNESRVRQALHDSNRRRLFRIADHTG
jgi:NTE family protein